MKNNLSFLLCLVLIPAAGFAQKFWLTTYEFPFGPKTGISSINDSLLFVGLTNGVIKSDDEGGHFERVLSASHTYTVYSDNSGLVLAGGRGQVYFSQDAGVHWDSVSLNHDYPVVKFARNSVGGLFAITGEYSNDEGYIGSGVFYSADNGYIWTPRNNGLGASLCCDQMVIDHQNKVYVTVNDEYSDGNGGLYCSEDNGLHWVQLQILIDGEGIIEDMVFMTSCSGLSISPQDTLYLSLEGSAGSAAVRLNLCMSLSEIDNGTYWHKMRVAEVASWWLDRPLNNIHFAGNGDWYSSMTNSINLGGTFFKKNGTGNWHRQTQGLGLDVFQQYNAQLFTETSAGKIFMVQYMDERVYWADTSAVTPVHTIDSKHLTVFPSLVPAQGRVQVETGNGEDIGMLAIYGLDGQLISNTILNTPKAAIEAPGEPGYYLVSTGRRCFKLICF